MDYRPRHMGVRLPAALDVQALARGALVTLTALLLLEPSVATTSSANRFASGGDAFLLEDRAPSDWGSSSFAYAAPASEPQIAYWAEVVATRGAAAAVAEMTETEEFSGVCDEFLLGAGEGVGGVPGGGSPTPTDPSGLPAGEPFDASACLRNPSGYAGMLYAVLLGNDRPSAFQVDYWRGRLSCDPAGAVVEFVSSPAFEGAGYSPRETAQRLDAGVFGSVLDFFTKSWGAVQIAWVYALGLLARCAFRQKEGA